MEIKFMWLGERIGGLERKRGKGIIEERREEEDENIRKRWKGWRKGIEIYES
jgi:hypothetical protein